MAVSTADVESVVRRVDSLETGKRMKAIRLLDDAGGPGVKLIDEMNSRSFKKLLKLDTAYSAKARKKLAQKVSNGDISASRVEQFAIDSVQLKHEDGFENIILDIATQRDVSGPIYEARVAAEIGTDRIHVLSRDVGESGEKGEIDIELENGDIIEVKDKEWSQMGPSQYKDLDKKLETSVAYKDMDEKSIIYVVKELSVGDSRRKEFADHWEEKAKQDYDVDIDFKFVESASKA